MMSRMKFKTEFGDTKTRRIRGIKDYILSITNYRIRISTRAANEIEKWGHDDIYYLVKWFNDWVKRHPDEYSGQNKFRGMRSIFTISKFDIDEYHEEEILKEVGRREYDKRKAYEQTPEAWLAGVLGSIETKATGIDETRMRNAAHRKYQQLKLSKMY